MLVAANIVWTGYQLMSRSAAGLMDVSLPTEELKKIESLLAGYREQGLDFHALRTRRAGGRAFMTMHILVLGRWTVQYGHDWAERIENDIRTALPFYPYHHSCGTVGRSRVNERPNARHF
uniref:Cobalt-zinc-cadmium resistance protein n=1 Tax=Klebsiella pneumoniae TaxID=573 RepID=A0A8B0SUZ4_KLEPN|nr:Cobalt-zinc-cadmium resistance protein [Klebsiella pneumoniae]